MPNTIYRNWNYGLGDVWATIQLLARIQRPGPILLSTVQHGQSLRAMQEAVLRAMDQQYFDNEIILVDDEPNTELDGYAVWAAPMIPAKHQWSLGPRDNKITVQFDGASTPELKNPPPGDIVTINLWAQRHGFAVVIAGKDLGLEKSIWAMRTSVLFVGICSGMSHVAHSVSVPTYILEYDLPVVTCHRHRNYVLCKGAGHFISQAENYLTFLRFINQ
jgi:hypothetical protein